MSDTIKESTPMLTPDGLRRVLQFLSGYYDTHTKKNFGRTDINGSQYSGTIENFGFEMLLETRKIKMEKPSLKGLTMNNSMDYYFDIQFSNMINTYDQQNIIEAVLKKDVFLSNKVYTLRFDNCEEKYVLRSEGWGAYNEETKSLVYRDRFIHTLTPPILVITDPNDSSSKKEIPMAFGLSSEAGFQTDYYFYCGISTNDFIDSYNDGTLITKPITDNMNGLPWIWMCIDIFRLLPNINFTGNSAIDGYPLLVIGTDGHARSHLYPYVFGDAGLPASLNDGEWYIKAYSSLDGFSQYGGENNYHSKISTIKFVHIIDGNIDQEYEIGYKEDFIKITLSKEIPWEIKRDALNSPYYAIVRLDEFSSNGMPDASDRHKMTEGFDISFSDKYLHPYEGICGGASSGIHVDVLSDYSDNSVPKKNGIIHSLSDFDGLPNYFKKMKDRTIHRSHVELYSIRDLLNEFTQNPTEKQTSGLLLDSAMPQDELKKLLDEQTPGIVYTPHPDKYLYTTNQDDVISMNNVLSEVVYVDENTFGNSNSAAYKNKPKFVYHGNRVFSLWSMEFDPELEMARVYYVNNDPISYSNNAAAENKKPARTLARICDIPTSYDQLMHVENTSATYLFDDKYVRMDCSYTNEDIDILMNERMPRLVRPKSFGGPGKAWVLTPGPMGNPDVVLSKNELIRMGYYKTHINDPNIPLNQDMFEIVNGGTGYEVNDTFYVLIGGKAYDCVVTSASSGVVQSFTIDLSDDDTVSVYNLYGLDTILDAKNVHSEQGADLKINLHVSEEVRNSHMLQTVEVPPDETLICLRYDSYGNIWIWEMDNEWKWHQVCQISGLEYIDNVYDDNPTRGERMAEKVFLRWILSGPNGFETNLHFNMLDYIQTDEVDSFLKNVYPDNPTEDLSGMIPIRNKSDTLYEFVPKGVDSGTYNLVTYELSTPFHFIADGDTEIRETANPVTLPQFHQHNTYEYFNKTNRFMKNNITSVNATQPTLYLYSPKRDYIIDEYTKMRDTVYVKSQHKITFKDVIPDSRISSTGILENNIYYYPEYEHTREFLETQNDTLLGKGRTSLLKMIKENFGYSAEPVLLEDSDYKYSEKELINYIMDRYPSDRPVYVKDNLKPLRYAGEKVMSGTEPEGLQPTGGFISLTDNVVDVNVMTNGVSAYSEFVNIFMIDDPDFTGFDNSFRIHDEDGTDITESSIVLWNGGKYIFREEWIKLAKPIVSGYLSPVSHMFFYNEQYTEQITPDKDFTYCDITTGQYYKWNGQNYSLINIS